MLRFWAVSGALFCSFSALASVSLFDERLDPSITSESQAAVGMEMIDYLYSPRAGGQAAFPNVAVEWKGARREESWEAKAHLESDVLFGSSSWFSFEAPEAYVGTHDVIAPWHAYFGRKLVSWNKLDETWKLGIWQPRFRWDIFNPEQIGLSGAFLQWESKWLHLTGFLSYFYVPDRGGPIDFNDGVASSPWVFYIPLPTQTSMFADSSPSTPVKYDLHAPSIADIVFRPSASLMAKVGERQGLWGSASFAIKPMNQILLSHDSTYSLSKDEVDVALYPRVVYHRLGSLEAGYEGTPVSAWISALGEEPLGNQIEPSWTNQEVVSALSVSPAFEWKLGDDELTRIQVGYLKQWGGNAPDSGSLQTANSVFEPRYPYQSAWLLSARAPLPRAWIQNLSASISLLYDGSHSGGIWTAQMRYFPRPRWSVLATADLISSSTPPGSNDFFTKYRAYDRMTAGVSYVF